MDVSQIDDVTERCWILSMVTGGPLFQTPTPLLVYRDEMVGAQTLRVLSAQRIPGVVKFTLTKARMCADAADETRLVDVFVRRAIVVGEGP